MSDRNPDPASDDELLARARGDPQGEPGRAALSALLARYQDRVYLWCLRISRNHEQALDLAQEVLLAACRRLDTFEQRSGFASWLFAIARNRCLTAHRRPALFRDDEAAIDAWPDPGPEPDEALEERIDEEKVLNLVRTHLDPLEQRALWLRCFEGIPVDEITRLLGLESATGARGLLQRARRKLRAAMSGGRDPAGSGGAGPDPSDAPKGEARP